MRPSSTAILAAGVAAGLVALPANADAATRHPAPGQARRVPVPGVPDDVAPWPRHSHAGVPFHPDAVPVPDFDDEPSWPDRDTPVFPDDEEPEPGRIAHRPAPSPDAPPVHHRSSHGPRASKRHRPLPADRAAEGPIPDRMPPWPVIGGVSVCVDVDVVAVVRVIIQVGCECTPTSPPPPPRPRPPRRVRPPSPPRRVHPIVAERPKPPAVRPPAPPKTPAPSVAPPVHRAITPRASLPHHRKSPLGTVMVLVVLTVVISAGAGIAFGSAR